VAHVLAVVTQDWKTNRGNPRIQMLLVLFRLANLLRQPTDARPRLVAIPLGLLYRFLAEGVMSFELPWKTTVGLRLTVFHGYALVVNDGTRIGDDVVLRHGVTLGHLVEGGPCPVIGDRVEFGAGSSVLGPVKIGAGARIGAGAVVLSDVPPGATVVGVPARVVSAAEPASHDADRLIDADA
jgi:serine acetyltransferase